MENCPVCEGTGLLLKDVCPLCGGESAEDCKSVTSGSSEISGEADLDSSIVDTTSLSRSAGRGERDEGLIEIVRGFQNGDIKRVIVCTGAGISVSSGIPDFRSPGGLFEQIREELGKDFPEVLHEPEIALSRGFANAYPQEHARVLDRHMLSEWSTAQPGDCHFLLSLLSKKGLLQRIYTQNVDGMHQRAGVPDGSVVEVHGSIARGDLVLYGDSLPSKFFQTVAHDFPRDSTHDKCDLMLVIGSSLQVAPFCALPNIVRRDVPRVLVTRSPHQCCNNAFSKTADSMYHSDSGGCRQASDMHFGKRKVTLVPQWGLHSKYKRQWVFDCDADDWARHLVQMAGWSEDLENLQRTVMSAP